MMALLADASLDLFAIAKDVAQLGTPALLAVGLYVIDQRRERERSACEAEKVAIRAEAEKKLQAAQDKLDAFQDARIRELSEMYRQATSGGAK